MADHKQLFVEQRDQRDFAVRKVTHVGESGVAAQLGISITLPSAS